MVYRRAQYPTLEDTGGSNDPNVMAEMCVTMNEMHRQNQAIENNVLNISTVPLGGPLEESEVLDP